MERAVKKTFPVAGMHCASCALRVEKTINNQQGVKIATVNFPASTVLVEYDPEVADTKKFKEALEELGYDIFLEDIKTKQVDEAAEKETAILKHNTVWAAFLALPVVIIGMFLMDLPYRNWIMLAFSTPVVFWFGRGFFINAIRQLRHGEVTMDTLVALSTGIAYLFSLLNTIFPHFPGNMENHHNVYYEASSVIIVFILMGRLLEGRAKSNTSTAIKKLMGLQPDFVTLVQDDDKEIIFKIEDVCVGNKLRVKPGERIPVDGEITEGSSFIDESSITGEPLPVEKGPGSKVFAGTINQKGSFIMKAEKVGSETLLARIIKMVQEAQGSKPPVQKLVDKIASVFVPVVIGIAVLTFSLWMIFGGSNSFGHALLAMVSVLIIACPCALGLATPTAIMVGIGKGAEHGILIKDADSLEQIHKVDTIVMDKTGTVTEGKPEVTNWIWKTEDREYNKQVLLGIESQSEHPLAEAIVKSLQDENISPARIEKFESITGHGVIATTGTKKFIIGNETLLDKEGIVLSDDDKRTAGDLEKMAKTVLFFSSDKLICAIIGIADAIKPSSPGAIDRLKRNGISVHMLTGDNDFTAQSIARQAGIDNYRSGLLPDEKAEYIKQLQKSGRKVLMVGDGINDSQAMAQADVSIAMGKGSDIAMDVAGMTIVSSNLDAIPSAIILSKLTIKTIRQNLFWAFFYNIIAIPVAAGLLYPFTGFMLNPMIAGAAMALSSVSVVSNSLRLKLKSIS